jgi:hypothetical protein
MFVVLKKDYFGHEAGTTFDIDEPHCNSLAERGIVEAVKGDPYGPLMTKAEPTFKPASWRLPATSRSNGEMVWRNGVWRNGVIQGSFSRKQPAAWLRFWICSSRAAWGYHQHQETDTTARCWD